MRCSDHKEEHSWDTEKNVKMLKEYLTPAVKHGGGNVMVWGCFGGGKVGDLYRVKGILKEAMTPFSNAMPYPADCD